MYRLQFSRTGIFILKLKDFQGFSRCVNPVLYRIAFYVGMKSYPPYRSHGFIMSGGIKKPTLTFEGQGM